MGHINGTVQHVADICNGRNTLAHHADIAPVNVKDVCAAHIAAMERDSASGKRYLCAPHMIPTLDLIRLIKKYCPAAVQPQDSPPEEPLIVGAWGKCRSTETKLAELGIHRTVSVEGTIMLCLDSLVLKGYVQEFRQ